MLWLVALMSLSILGLIVLGLIADQRPDSIAGLRRWLQPLLGSQLLVFLGAQIGLLILGVNEALATPAAAEGAGASELSIGQGLAMIGVGIPTGLSTIGAGIAVGPIGAASLAAITERPENLGRTLIYLGLAEGIAIYGLVISILLLNKL